MKKAGIYIHIPFCVKKCNYCAFVSGPADDGTIARYVDALINEIRGTASRSNPSADTIYIGGGTPSLIEPKYIERILDAVRDSFCIIDAPEITIEANPATLTFDKLKAYRHAGINRLSMGVQSFDDGILERLGRVHTAEDVVRDFEKAREAGFENINLDLMFGIPGQTLGGVEYSIKKATELGPEHISYYSLQLEEGTSFWHDFEAGEFREVPDEIDREMYHRGIAILRDAGYVQYEISNFAKRNLTADAESNAGRNGNKKSAELPAPLTYESRHNSKYWDMSPYYGFGLAASSFVPIIKSGSNITGSDAQGNYSQHVYSNAHRFDSQSACVMARTTNTSDMSAYLNAYGGEQTGASEAGEQAGTGKAVSEMHINTEHDNISEAIFTGLRRTRGILFTEIPCHIDCSAPDGSRSSQAERENLYRKAFYRYYADILQELNEFRDAGFLEIDERGLRLTESGINISNRIMALFV